MVVIFGGARGVGAQIGIMKEVDDNGINSILRYSE